MKRVLVLALLAPCLLLAVFFGSAGAQGCPLPPEYTHTASAFVGDVRVTLAVGQDHYAVGDPITFRLSFENTGSTTQVVPNPSLIDPLLFIALLPARCDSLQEAGCYEDGEWIYRYPPGGWFFFGAPITLQPGACWPLTNSWDGIPRQGGTTPPGLYRAFAGAWNGNSIFFPAGGVELLIQIGSTSGIPPTPVEATTWGRIKTRFP